MAESEAIRAASLFEDKLSQAVGIAELLRDAAGADGPAWVYHHHWTLQELANAAEPVICAINRGPSC